MFQIYGTIKVYDLRFPLILLSHFFSPNPIAENFISTILPSNSLFEFVFILKNIHFCPS